MVKKLLFFVFLLFVMISFGQKKVVNRQTFDVILLSEVQKIEDCGTVYWHVQAKFKILTKRKQKSKIQDTVSFYISCPNEYGPSFWNKDSTYTIKYKKYDEKKYYDGVVTPLNENLDKIKIVGVIYDAQKLR